MASNTYEFVKRFLEVLANQNEFIGISEFATTVNATLNNPLRADTAMHQANLVRRELRTRGMIEEERRGRSRFFKSNVTLLQVVTTADSLSELASGIITSIGKYKVKYKTEAAQGVPRTKGNGQEIIYVCQKTAESFAVKFGGIIAEVANDRARGLMLTVATPNDRQEFPISFLVKEEVMRWGKGGIYEPKEKEVLDGERIENQ